MVGAAPAIEFIIAVPTLEPVGTAVTREIQSLEFEPATFWMLLKLSVSVMYVLRLSVSGRRSSPFRSPGRRKSDQAGNVPRHNVVEVGYGIVAAAAVDEVAAHTGFDIVIASAGKDDVVSAITVDGIGGTVSPEERFGFAGTFDNSHGHAPSWLEPSFLCGGSPAHTAIPFEIGTALSGVFP